jgi:uncharacterized protein YbaR (Trm112 family)
MSDESGQSVSSPERGVAPLLASVLDQLACPSCFGDLHLDGPRLRCNGCGRIYPIVDGIPVLIMEPIEQIANES